MSDSTRAALERLVEDTEYLAKGGEDLDRAWAAIAAGKAALAERQGEVLSDEDLLQVAIDTRLCRFQATAGDPVQYELTEAQINAYARAVLARWGRQPAPTDHRGALPMIVSETGACDEPETERIICASISGGADYINNMPRTLTLERINSEGSTYQKYIQDPTSVMATHPTPQPPALGEGPSADEWDALVKRAWDQYIREPFPQSGDCFSDFSNALDLLRREIARWGHPAPQPPIEGEGLSDEEWDALVERAWDKYETAGYQGERFMYCGDFGNALDLVRKEFARWGRQPVPQPPAEGEVAELLADLEVAAVTVESEGGDHEAAAVRRAATLLQQQQAEIQKLWTSAALRAATDQSENLYDPHEGKVSVVRVEKLLAIAAELEGK